MTVLSTLAGIGMAVGPPLIYVDQAYSIIKKKDSSGFSHDVCGVVIIANITRIFFWLGNRFETRELLVSPTLRHPDEHPNPRPVLTAALLVQSMLLVISQLLLLSLCLHYAPLDSTSSAAEYASMPPLTDQEREEHAAQSGFVNQCPQESRSKAAPTGRRRPFDFWQWDGYGSYLEFLAGFIVLLGLLQVIFGRWMWYIDALGFLALTIESTLPIPQFIANYKRKSTYGLRASTLAGWFFGDAYKTVYFFLRHSPIQFQITAIMTLCWDAAVFAQRLKYGTEPPRGMINEEHDREDARGLRGGGM